MSEKPSIYIANQLGFNQPGRLFLTEYLLPLLTTEVPNVNFIEPFSLTDPNEIGKIKSMPISKKRVEAYRAFNKKTGARNRVEIAGSQGLLALLDGTEVSSGIAAEIGYGTALGLPITGYRSDFRLAGDNEGSLIDLQVEEFISLKDGKIVRTMEELPAAIKNMLRNSQL